jgi:hypothetical protein
VKMAATTATAPAAMATDAAIRFRRFSGQRHLARDSEVGGAVPVTSTVVLVAAGVGSVVGSPVAVGVGSAVGSLVAAGVGSVVSFEFGSGGVSLGPGVSVISSRLPTDVMRRMCRSEVDAVNQAGGFAAHDPSLWRSSPPHATSSRTTRSTVGSVYRCVGGTLTHFICMAHSSRRSCCLAEVSWSHEAGRRRKPIEGSGCRSPP